MSTRLDAAAIILAAGEGRRMGGVAKAALRLPSGETFLERIVATLRAVGVGEIVAVAGAHEIAAPEGVVPARNPRPEEGMLSSLQHGLRALLAARSVQAPRDPPGTILLWPVDAPRVPADVVRRVIDAVTGGADVAFPGRDGRGGHPAAFAGALVREILDAPPTSSTRDRLRRPGLAIRVVLAEAPEIFEDIDTEEAYRAMGERGG